MQPHAHAPKPAVLSQSDAKKPAGTPSRSAHVALFSTCQYENDGECDVPQHCPEGTDTADCGSTVRKTPSWPKSWANFSLF